MNSDNQELLGLSTGFVTYKDDKPREKRPPRDKKDREEETEEKEEVEGEK